MQSGTERLVDRFFEFGLCGVFTAKGKLGELPLGGDVALLLRNGSRGSDPCRWVTDG